MESKSSLWGSRALRASGSGDGSVTLSVGVSRRRKVSGPGTEICPQGDEGLRSRKRDGGPRSGYLQSLLAEPGQQGHPDPWANRAQAELHPQQGLGAEIDAAGRAIVRVSR